MPTLSRHDALAFNDDYAEFQQGRTIIRVDFPLYERPELWLGRASAMFEAIWNDAPKALAFAQAHLRTKEPERWRYFDAAGISAQVLVVDGIWIEPCDGLSSYSVSFDDVLTPPPGMAEWPDDEVVVDRSASGWLTSFGVTPPGSVTFFVPRKAGGLTVSWLPLRCPCCRCRTLARRGQYFICPVCFWEDDGQDNADADDIRGGPNGHLSLTQAQANYREFGASRRQDLPHVRKPRAEELPDERAARDWPASGFALPP